MKQTTAVSKDLIYLSMDLIKGLLKTMRPKHWVKNVVVFAALLFSTSFFNLQKDIRTIITFLIFCLLAGSIYIINDIADVEEDRKHPEKSSRPIASGKLGIFPAGISAGLFTIGSLAVGFYLNLYLGLILAAYFTVNLLYSFWLKEVIILDVLIIAAGFVFRAIAGAVAISVRISPWLVITTMFLALFLALNKRKAELKLMENASDARGSLENYTFPYLDQMIMVTTTAIIVSYSLYSFNSTHSDQMLWTIPFVIYGVFRYMYLTEVQGYGGQLSDVLLKDRPLTISILLWGLAVTGILVYFNQR